MTKIYSVSTEVKEGDEKVRKLDDEGNAVLHSAFIPVTLPFSSISVKRRSFYWPYLIVALLLLSTAAMLAIVFNLLPDSFYNGFQATTNKDGDAKGTPVFGRHATFNVLEPQAIQARNPQLSIRTEDRHDGKVIVPNNSNNNEESKSESAEIPSREDAMKAIATLLRIPDVQQVAIIQGNVEAPAPAELMRNFNGPPSFENGRMEHNEMFNQQLPPQEAMMPLQKAILEQQQREMASENFRRVAMDWQIRRELYRRRILMDMERERILAIQQQQHQQQQQQQVPPMFMMQPNGPMIDRPPPQMIPLQFIRPQPIPFNQQMMMNQQQRAQQMPESMHPMFHHMLMQQQPHAILMQQQQSQQPQSRPIVSFPTMSGNQIQQTRQNQAPMMQSINKPEIGPPGIAPPRSNIVNVIESGAKENEENRRIITENQLEQHDTAARMQDIATNRDSIFKHLRAQAQRSQRNEVFEPEEPRPIQPPPIFLQPQAYSTPSTSEAIKTAPLSISVPFIQRDPDEIFHELQQRAMKIQMEQDRKEAEQKEKTQIDNNNHQSPNDGQLVMIADTFPRKPDSGIEYVETEEDEMTTTVTPDTSTNNRDSDSNDTEPFANVFKFFQEEAKKLDDSILLERDVTPDSFLHTTTEPSFDEQHSIDSESAEATDAEDKNEQRRLVITPDKQLPQLNFVQDPPVINTDGKQMPDVLAPIE